MFKETVWKLQASKLKIDSLQLDPRTENRVLKDDMSHRRMSFPPRQRMIGLMNVLKEKAKDSAGPDDVIVERQMHSKRKHRGRDFPNNRLMQFFIRSRFFARFNTFKRY